MFSLSISKFVDIFLKTTKIITHTIYLCTEIKLVHVEKIFAGLANRIIDIKHTNFFCRPKKILDIRTRFFVETIKEFVGRTNILLGQQKKFKVLYQQSGLLIQQIFFSPR